MQTIAAIHASQGQYEKARAALEQSIRTRPGYATAYENLGHVYAKLASQPADRDLYHGKQGAS
jgi:tetratricopeptide (TPR) repeat protein